MKKRLVLYSVLILVVTLVMADVFVAGDGHVTVVKENVSLTEENQTLTKQNEQLTQENKQLNEKVETLETAIETYEKADSSRNSRSTQSWEFAIPID